MTLLTTLILLQTAAADDPVFSGPQPGEPLTPFVIQEAGGDTNGRRTVLEKPEKKPVVLVFVHERTRPAFGLANTVMTLVAQRGQENITGSLVFLSADPTEAVAWMNRVSRHLPTKVTTGVSIDGSEGPGAYGLNRNVAMTILIAQDNKVTANFALVQPSLEVDGPEIFRAIADALGEKEAPTLESVRRMAASDRGQMQRRPGAEANRQDPRLRPLLAAVIKKELSDEQVEAAAVKVEQFADNHPDARQQIGDIARRIISSGRLTNYGTKRCQEFLTKWSNEFKPAKPNAEPKSEQR